MAKPTVKPEYQNIDGILFPPFPPDKVRQILNYKPKPDDVFIASYPKCGTTWMQNIVLYIFRKGQELENHKDFHTFCPFIDAKGIKGIENMPRPGAFKTHLPCTHVPYSADAKYVYVLRNPKDCCVSMYYHVIRGAKAHHGAFAEATFDDFFEIFMSGEVEYSDYFDHLMSWYPHRNGHNVLFTTYEDMKKGIKSVVLKVASFLGQEYIEAINKDNNVLNNIMRFSGFDYTVHHLSEVFERGLKCKDHDSNKTGRDKLKCEHSKKENIPFFRKGIVGDWENHFSEEQNERTNRKFTERTQGTEIYDMYKSYILA